MYIYSRWNVAGRSIEFSAKMALFWLFCLLITHAACPHTNYRWLRACMVNSWFLNWGWFKQAFSKTCKQIQVSRWRRLYTSRVWEQMKRTSPMTPTWGRTEAGEGVDVGGMQELVDEAEGFKVNTSMRFTHYAYAPAKRDPHTCHIFGMAIRIFDLEFCMNPYQSVSLIRSSK